MTSDPFSDIPAAASLELPDLADVCAELQQPYDDAPQFDGRANPEIDTQIRLAADKSYLHTPTRRLYHDYRANMDAYRHLTDLPAEGESLHGIISGKYALWELVPALLERTGQHIDELYIATLGFSKANGAEMLGLIDDGFIRRLSMIVSYYFKSTSTAIYDSLIPPLLHRGQRVLSMRNHCKLILAKLVDGTCYTVESSANLRSCVNVEQFVLTRDVGLFNFHREWMQGELLNKSEQLKNGPANEQTTAA